MKLCIIMPVFNEEESIEKTFNEWENVIEENKYFSEINFLLINDGSNDNTIVKLNEIFRRNKKSVIIINQENQGHGQSCLFGYNYAYDNQYDYILQLDSDGQCDPKYFYKFVNEVKNGSEVVYGFRYYRKDGLIRFFVSRILSIVAFYETKIWIWDPNVPYRLFKTSTLKKFLSKSSKEINLVNVLLALYHKKYKITYVPIVFRDRHGGSPSISTNKLYKHGQQFYKQLRSIKSILQ